MLFEIIQAVVYPIRSRHRAKAPAEPVGTKPLPLDQAIRERVLSRQLHPSAEGRESNCSCRLTSRIDLALAIKFFGREETVGGTQKFD